MAASYGPLVNCHAMKIGQDSPRIDKKEDPKRRLHLVISEEAGSNIKENKKGEL